MSKKHAHIKAGGKLKIKSVSFKLKGLKGDFDLSALFSQFGNLQDNRKANQDHRNNNNRNR